MSRWNPRASRKWLLILFSSLCLAPLLNAMAISNSTWKRGQCRDPSAMELMKVDGEWIDFDNFVNNIKGGVSKADLFDGKAFKVLHRANVHWIVLIGDSNTRYTFYELVTALCTPTHVACLYVKPHVEPQFKLPQRNNMPFRLNDNGPNRISHSDQDLVVADGEAILRISFRMSFGVLEDLVTVTNDFNVQRCKDYAKQHRCDSSFAPELKYAPPAQPYPDAIFIAEGVWRFATILSEDTGPLFSALSALSNQTMVFWMNQFDVFPEFMNINHYDDFTKAYGLEKSKTIVGLTNIDRERKASLANLRILNISAISKKRQIFYERHFKSSGPHGADGDNFRKYISNDGVHQSSKVYDEVMKLIIGTVILCRKETR